MNQNRVFSLNTEGATETPVVQTNVLCILIRKKKLMWILFYTIAIILIVLTVTIPTIVSLKEKMNREPSITSTTTTSTTTTTVTTTAITEAEGSLKNITITNNTKWKQDGTTVAGGNYCGHGLNQIVPYDMYIDDDQTIYIADGANHRILEWKRGAKSGQVVAGGDVSRDSNDQLYYPKAITLDKENDFLIICDGKNRVMRWSRQNRIVGEIIISYIPCSSLTMDKEGYLYVSDRVECTVKRWKVGDIDGTIVAGGNGPEDHCSPSFLPTFIFVNQDQSVYVSDPANNRVMKWMTGANEGVVVAGGQDLEENLGKLNRPTGIFVDQLGNVYIAERTYNRVVRWLKGATQGSIVVGGNGYGQAPNQLALPIGLSFDRQGNLYVADSFNCRIQRFDIDLD